MSRRARQQAQHTRARWLRAHAPSTLSGRSHERGETRPGLHLSTTYTLWTARRLGESERRPIPGPTRARRATLSSRRAARARGAARSRCERAERELAEPGERARAARGRTRVRRQRCGAAHPSMLYSDAFLSSVICLPPKMRRCCGGGMPSFSSTRSLMRPMVSSLSMSISISLPVSVFTLICGARRGCGRRAESRRDGTRTRPAPADAARAPPLRAARSWRRRAHVHVDALDAEKLSAEKDAKRADRCHLASLLTDHQAQRSTLSGYQAKPFGGAGFWWNCQRQTAPTELSSLPAALPGARSLTRCETWVPRTCARSRR